MRAAGILVALFGLALTLRSAQLLSGRGRPRRGPQPEFVLAGPYLRLRNPLYGGVVLALAGVAFGTASVVLALGALGAGVAAHLWVVWVEEPRLRARFGRAYAEYLGRIPRWLPKLGRS